MTNKRRRRAHVWGVVAEYLSVLLLLCKGYSILEMRHRNRGGEIDIIAARGKVIVFIEVKARGVRADALESVTQDKRRRLARAAELYVAKRARFAQHGLRFDVMVVTSPWNIHHLKNAWSAE